MPEKEIDYKKTWERFYEQLQKETDWTYDNLVSFEESYDKTSDGDRIRHAYKQGMYCTYKSILDYVEFLDKGRYFKE